MTTDDFTKAARAEAEGRYLYGRHHETTYTDYAARREQLAFEVGAVWGRDHLAAQEPTEDDVQAAVAAILALTDETEETARMDDIDVAWDHARAALSAARAARRDKEDDQ